MTWVSNLKNFLNQNLFASLFLYVLALVEPVCMITFIHFDFMPNPYNVMWISCYACILLWWACDTKFYQRMINVILTFLNISIIGVLCMGSLMGGIYGLFLTLLLLFFPFAVPLMRFIELPYSSVVIFIGSLIVAAIIGFIIYKHSEKEIDM